MKRQPIVVSKISALRAKASSAFPCTKGARVMDSTPPASANSISPALMARAAVPTASMPEAHSRLSVTPGTLCGKPGQEQRHARDVAVVFAGLVGAAVKHLVELFPVDMGVALLQRAQRHRGQIVGAHLGERAAEAADRRARGVADEDFTHFVAHHAASAVARAVRACSARSTSSSCAVGGGVSSTCAAYFTGQPVFS